jgi:heterodisulfide reductase subunit D
MVVTMNDEKSGIPPETTDEGAGEDEKVAKLEETAGKLIGKSAIDRADSIDHLYYLGCTASYDINVKEVGINTINVMNALGVRFGILGPEEKCCGSVLLRIGDHEFERLSEYNIRLFNALNVKRIFTSCAGCYRTLKVDYKKMGTLHAEVVHSIDIVDRAIQEGRLTLTHEVPVRATYHDPCHMGRHSNWYDAPRRVLNAIPGLEFVECDRVREFSRCCGAGGGLKAGFGDVQALMAQERAKDAEKLGATHLVSTCPFCYQGLQVGLNALKSKVKMTDLMELVAKAMGIETMEMETGT